MTKTLKVALQMDALEGIDVAADTSFALGLEAQKRGHELFFYLPESLTLDGQKLTARLTALTLRDEAAGFFTYGATQQMDLAALDVVLIRQDPPFDMAYITNTYLLEKLQPDVLVVNNPTTIRNAPEKLLPFLFDGLGTATMISRDKEALKNFRKAHKDIIIKPLYGNGGAGVFHVPPEGENFAALLDMFFTASNEPIIAQKYLPEIKQGDKRIILIEGQAVGALNRVPSKGDARANVHAGGTAEAAELTASDKAIVDKIGGYLREAGIVLAGIDVIGDRLTEINITSPTCLREIKAFGGADIAALFWDAVEKRRG